MKRMYFLLSMKLFHAGKPPTRDSTTEKPGGGSRTPPALRTGIMVLSGSMCPRKRMKRCRGATGLLTLALLFILTAALTAVLPFTGSRVSAAEGAPPLSVKQVITVEDGSPSSEQIAYHMEAVTPGAPLPGGATGNFLFDISGTEAEYVLPDITYTEPGTYVYSISRVSGGELTGYTYDDAAFTIEVYVSPGTGVDGWNINQSVKDADGYKCAGIEFDHHYKPLASDPSIMVDPPVKKQVDGAPDKDGNFRFSLTAEKETNPMPEGSKDGRKLMTIVGPGEKDFGTWPYTHTGTYRYSIAEVDVGEEGYTYDNSIYTITDVVTDQSGVLKVDRTTTDVDNNPVTAFSFTNKYKKSPGGGSLWPPGGQGMNTGSGNTVLTGDAIRMLAMEILSVLAAISLIVVAGIYRRRHKDKEGRHFK